MAITDRELKTARGPGKAYVGDGLFAILREDGRHWWRFRWRLMGKEKTLSLGVYPEVTITEAKRKARDLRIDLERGTDVAAARRQTKLSAAGIKSGATFGEVAEEWKRVRGATWSAHYQEKVRGTLSNILPVLGPEPIAFITTPQLRQALRVIEARGALEVAGKARELAGAVFRFGMALGLEGVTDVAAPLRGTMTTRITEHFRKLERRDLGPFLQALKEYPGRPETQLALELLTRLFVRPGELRHAQWQHIDLEAGEWRIPAELMKARQMHVVPLPTQAVALLRELKAYTGHGCYCFPGQGKATVMSENTLAKGIRLVGFGEKLVAHGLRATAATILHESGEWNSDAIERQLAHAERNKVKAAYARSAFLPERRRMMQWYSDLLDAERKASGRKADA